MTKIEAYLADAAHYIDEGSRAIVEDLTEAQFDALVAATDALNSGCDQPGIDNSLVRTHEAIADFDASRAEHWNERGSREELEVEGLPAVLYERVQMLKGMPRASFIVVDLGDSRVVVK